MAKESACRTRLKNWEEWRRLRAYDLNRKGWKQTEIALALGVTKGSVSKWLSRSTVNGKRALRSKPRSGAPCKLEPIQLKMIPEFLWHGAESYGFLGNVWTCGRVATVIRREFGVQYHRHHVAKILKNLGWTPQKPIVRASQRNEDDIEKWRTDIWPELKKSEKRRKNASFCR